MSQHQVKRLVDYEAPSFTITDVSLSIGLDEHSTRVESILKIERRDPDAETLFLDGEELKLESVTVIGNAFPLRYEVNDKQLSLTVPANISSFSLRIVNILSPISNTSLEGLYCSDGAFCTQCEAEGFRKITYYLDRPDVLAKFDVYVEAQQVAFPYLLSNGNLVEKGVLDNGRHWAKWQDPHPKPSYLFALVAGDFDVLTDQFVTQSGRQVALELYVDKGQAFRGNHALSSLKKSMLWDEETFGLEYDLDVYMIVAVDFFNMGAMENKGLNVFNSKYVLADPQSATDTDFFNIESIIGHEYFHNWSGNRVTCRDWFQLSLKEGLTVFRDQQFSNDMSSPLVNRIQNVRVIREHQFVEDAGPMSHPIRPEQVMEMNNFYTVTVYDKGAEVIRMLHTLLGVDGFRAGMDLYFERHDGQAVTCDDFVNAMEDATQISLVQFRRWYSQAGTPEVTVVSHYDAGSQIFELDCQQAIPTQKGPVSAPLHIPMDVEFIDCEGNNIPMVGGKPSKVESLTGTKQKFSYTLPKAPAAVSLFRNFSAPVKLHYQRDVKEIQHCVAYSSDPFNRWDALQLLYMKAIQATIDAENSDKSELVDYKTVLIETLSTLIQDKKIDSSLLAECLVLPSLESVFQNQPGLIDVHQCFEGRQRLQQHVAKALSPCLKDLLSRIELPGQYYYQQADVNQRRLVGVVLTLLAIANSKNNEYWLDSYTNSNNMTDTLNILSASQHSDGDVFEQLMAKFEKTWRTDVLVLDKWFALSAGANVEAASEVVEGLMAHPQYSINNPNRVRSVWGAFCKSNTLGFHHKDGSGYQLLASYLVKLDTINPQVAARLVEPLLQLNRYTEVYRGAMEAALLTMSKEKLSKDVYEKVSKALKK